AHSHTAAALRGDAVVDALFHQAGVLRFRSGEQLFSAAQFFSCQSLPRGRRVAIVSNSAGVATLAIDACATRELTVSKTASQLENPMLVGVGAGAADYSSHVRGALADASVDAVMVLYIDRCAGKPGEILDAVSGAALGQVKPVVATIVGTDGKLPARSETSVPNFAFPEMCAGVLGRAAERREWLSRPLGEHPRFGDLDAQAARAQIGASLEAGRRWLTLDEAQALLATHGIAFEPSTLCSTVEDAVAAAREVGAPIALKAALPAPETASDIDAVLLGLEGDGAVEAGWRELQRRVETASRRFGAAIVQRLVPAGADLLVGAVSDPDLGPVMAVGLGGRQAGLAAAAAFRVLPSTDVEADELVDASEAVVMQLDGFRSGRPLKRDALRDLLLRFSALLRECPEAVEVDLNPVRLAPDACVVLDAQLCVERRAMPERVKTW
ncbi:MAG: acetate--CoA ligase family protein, partial [Solirubrobacterales bacterium]|nr:acetate--CoA ligase family protein [Solirubrobacterales bacterium]